MIGHRNINAGTTPLLKIIINQLKFRLLWPNTFTSSIVDFCACTTKKQKHFKFFFGFSNSLLERIALRWIVTQIQFQPPITVSRAFNK